MGSIETKINGATQPCPAVRHFIQPDVLAKIPALGALEDVDLLDCIVHAKLLGRVGPLRGWVWYILEIDPVEGIAFGFVSGFDAEYGEFDLAELFGIVAEFSDESGDAIIADSTFTPRALRDVEPVEEKP